MRKLSLADKIRDCGSRGEVLPLNGKIRLILEDVRDGTQKVEEVHNIATNAVQTILARNYSGLANVNSLLPLKQLYGGVFLYQNAQTENANQYNPYSDLDNPLIAHAGDQANNTGSTLRGSPVSNEYVETDTSIKQVWLWDNTQGNGHIESVSLVPALLGNMGTKPYNNEFNPMSTFGNDQLTSGITTWNVDIAKQYPFNLSNDGKTSWTVWLDGDTFTEYTVRHDYSAFGIMRGSRDWQDVANRSATVRTGTNRFVFDDDDYYYIARVSSATSLQIDKVSKTTFIVTQADVSYSDVSLWTGTVESYKNGSIRIFPYDGTYLYVPNGNGNQFVRLNLSDTNDKFTLSGTLTIEKGQLVTQTQNGEQFMSPLAINTGIVLGGNYIINGDAVYPIKHVRAIGCASAYMSYNNWLWVVRQGAACYGNAKQTQEQTSSKWIGQSNVLCQMFLSSIANLQQARDKSTSQTMRVEYTSTEAT